MRLSGRADDRALAVPRVHTALMSVRRIGLTAALLFSAAGCTSDAEPDSPEPIVVTVGADWSLFPQARVSGDLSVDDAGCVRLDDFLVVWPFGSKWNTHAEALVFADDAAASLTEGAPFTGAGGSVPMRIWRRELDPAAVTALEECLTATDDAHAVFAYPEV